MTAKLQTIFNELTNRNEHTKATMQLALAVGGLLGAAYLVILQEIEDRYGVRGSIESNDRTMRDAIQADLLKTAKLKGLMG